MLMVTLNKMVFQYSVMKMYFEAYINSIKIQDESKGQKFFRQSLNG